MTKMTGGQALAKSLYMEGVRVVFGLPGVQLYGAMDGLYDEPGIEFITVRHEQAAAYMAFGYSCVSDSIGTALVVPGPGLQNASAGVGTAYAASRPMLIVAGQVNRDFIGSERGELHEVHDQLDTIKPVTKWAERVLTAAEVPAAVHEAFVQMRTGRPRPVEIEMPPDAMTEEADVELIEPAPVRPQAPNADAVKEAARLIAAAERPVIIAGGGAVWSGASEALTRLAEHLQAPVFTTSEGKGAISDRHYTSMGVPGFFTETHSGMIADGDVILAVGTRMARTVPSGGTKVVQIDVDPDEIGRNHSNTFPVLGDAALSVQAIYEAIESTNGQRPSRREEFEAFRRNGDHRFDPTAQAEPQGGFVRAIRSAVPEDGIVVEGVTQVAYACHTSYPVYQPKTYITSSYYGNLGYEYATALGAKVAQPEKAVVAVCGDGGFMYNVQELATAVKHGIGVVGLVFNDNAFGNVLRDQVRNRGGRVIGSELHNPDFVKLAEAFGARGIRVHEADELESAIKESLEVDGPTLVEIPVGMMPHPL